MYLNGIEVVTGQPKKHQAWDEALPVTVVRRNGEFDELGIHRRAPQKPLERVVYVASEKRREDTTWLTIAMLGALSNSRSHGEHHLMPEHSGTVDEWTYRLYIDTIQALFPRNANNPPSKTDMDASVAIEKPVSIESWIKDPDTGAMAQAGRMVEILTNVQIVHAPSNRDMNLLLRTRATMREYSQDELLEWIDHVGEQSILESASGFELANGGSKFYNKKEPLEVWLQRSLEEEPVLLARFDTWEHLSNDTLRQFVYGSFAPVVERVLDEFPGFADSPYMQ